MRAGALWRRFDLREEVQEVYLHRFLFKLALSSVAVFLPFYIYETVSSVSFVFVFFAIYYGTFIVASIPAALLASRVGYKHTSMFASVLIVSFYLLLRSVEALSPVLYLTAALGGLGFVVYWIGMNAEMARSSHSESREEETGFFYSVPILASIISPFLGGVVVSMYGFDLLFLLVVLLVIMSYLPFYFSSEHFSGMDADLKNVFSKRHMDGFMTFFFQGVNSMGRKVVWPLYVALVITGALNLGSVGSLMALGSAVVSVAMGRYVNADNRLQVILCGGILLAGSWLVMSFVVTPMQAFVISFANGLLRTVVSLPIYSGILGVAEEEDILEYFAFREIGLCLGRITLLIAMAGLFVFYGQEVMFLAGFSLLALSVGAMAFFARGMDFE
jgi:MFS family permease